MIKLPHVTMTLSRKALILVVLPLIFYTIILAVLLGLVIKSEQSTLAAEHVRALSVQADAIFEHVCEAQATLGYTSKHISRQFAILPKKIGDDLLKLKSLAANDAEESKAVKQIEKLTNCIIQNLGEYRTRVENDGAEFPIGIVDTRSQLIALLGELKRTIESLNPVQRRHSIDLDLVESREKIKLSIVAAFVVNAALALTLTAYYNRGTVRRLQVLMDNTRALAKREELGAPVGGEDEIAQLDATFHEMARSLKATERMKAEFTAMVTHDLRSPLTTMMTFLEMIEQEFFGPEPKQAIRKAGKTRSLLERLLLLVDDILCIEKMESGEFTLDLKDCNLRELVAESVHAVSGAATSCGVNIISDDHNVQVLADERRIIQVLTNLLANAIKFSPSQADINVKVANDGNFAVVEVLDCGPGVPNHAKEMVFEKFKQVKSRHSKAGTGLGLAICKQIIEQHGGKIGLRDADGGGSVFWFTLPKSSQLVKPEGLSSGGTGIEQS